MKTQQTIKVRLNDGTFADATCAARFSRTLGTQTHEFAVTRRPHHDRGWSLTHVASGWRVCRIHELPMVGRIGARNALSTGQLALQGVLDHHTLAVVATKLQQVTP